MGSTHENRGNSTPLGPRQAIDADGKVFDLPSKPVSIIFADTPVSETATPPSTQPVVPQFAPIERTPSVPPAPTEQIPVVAVPPIRQQSAAEALLRELPQPGRAPRTQTPSTTRFQPVVERQETLSLPVAPARAPVALATREWGGNDIGFPVDVAIAETADAKLSKGSRRLITVCALATLLVGGAGAYKAVDSVVHKDASTTAGSEVPGSVSEDGSDQQEVFPPEQNFDPNAPVTDPNYVGVPLATPDTAQPTAVPGATAPTSVPAPGSTQSGPTGLPATKPAPGIVLQPQPTHVPYTAPVHSVDPTPTPTVAPTTPPSTEVTPDPTPTPSPEQSQTPLEQLQGAFTGALDTEFLQSNVWLQDRLNQSAAEDNLRGVDSQDLNRYLNRAAQVFGNPDLIPSSQPSFTAEGLAGQGTQGVAGAVLAGHNMALGMLSNGDRWHRADERDVLAGVDLTNRAVDADNNLLEHSDGNVWPQNIHLLDFRLITTGDGYAVPVVVVGADYAGVATLNTYVVIPNGAGYVAALVDRSNM